MKNRYSYSEEKNTYLMFLIFISAVLLFCFENPNFLITSGLGFLGWIVYVPVLLLIKKASFKFVWLYGLFYGAISYGICGYWLYDYQPVALVIVCVSYALILAVVFLVLKLSDYIFRVNGWILQWAIICLYEYIKTLGYLGINYGVTAYTQWRYPVLIQICDLVGVFGLNDLMIFCSVVIYALIEKKLERKFVINQLLIGQEKQSVKSHINYASQKEKILKATSRRNPIIASFIFMILFISSLIYGIVKLQNNPYENCEKITVAAIQNNDISSKSSVDDYRINVRNLVALTEEAIEYNPNIEIIVWPETAVVPAVVYHYEEKKDLMRYTIVKSVLDYINLDDKTFILGNGHYGQIKNNYHEIFNSALVFEGKNNVIPPRPEVYVKQHLVPFSEYFPWEDIFPKFSKLLQNGQQVYWTPGKDNKVFKSKGVSFSTLICFEDTFTSIARNMYLKGSRCFFNLSNDSWAESRACQNQHLSMAVFRSVENKIPSVRSTSSGETCIIDCNGRIIAQAPDFCLSYVIGEIPIISENEKPGLYTQYGDFCGWGIVFVIILLLLIKIIIVIINAIKLRLRYR